MPRFASNDVAAWCKGTWIARNPPDCTSIAIDSRQVRPGGLFVALKGTNVDGHDFVRTALDREAAAAMVNVDFALSHVGWDRLIGVPDTRKALMDLACGHRDRLSSTMVAITGSVGKTTVKEMVADTLALRAPTARTLGNWNNDLGLPLSLLAMELDRTYGVFELGMNHPGELAPLCRLLRPKWGVVTGIGPAHIEFFKSVRAIAEEKSEVLKHLPADGCAVLNRDDDWFTLLKAVSPCRVLTVSLRSDEADYRAEITSDADNRFTVRERATGESHTLALPVPGRHMVANALYAVAIGRQCRYSWPELAEALLHVSIPPMRWQRVQVGEVECINDAYNANPMSMRAALRTLSALPTVGDRWVVLGGMRELGASEKTEHLALGREVAAGPFRGLIAVGAGGAWIAEGAIAQGMDAGKIFPCADPAEAARVLCGRTAAGDVVLLKASRGERLEDTLRYWTEEIENKRRKAASITG